MADKKITDYNLLTSGSINPNTALIEIVNFEQLINYKTTPEDLAGSVFSNKSILKSLTQSVIDNSPTSGQKAALVGTDGTPGISNPYVTDSDPRLTASGSITTASNLGTGEGQVYASTSGSTLQFRTIKASGNIAITNDTNEITIFSGYSSSSVSSFKRFTLNEDMVVKDQAVILSNGYIRKLRYDSFGVDAEFNSANNSAMLGISRLNDSKFIVGYGDTAGTDYMAVRIGTVASDNSITYGSEVSVFSGISESNVENVISLNDSKFIACYKNASDNGGYVKVGSISGTSITFGNAYFFATLAVDTNKNGDLIKLTDSKFVAFVRVAFAQAFVGSLTGSVVSFGAGNQYDTVAYMRNVEANTINSSKFVLSYTRYPDGSQANGSGSVRIGTVDENIITFGSASSFSFGHYNQYAATAVLNESKCVLGYSEGDATGVVRICDINGDELTLGNTYTFSSASVTNKKIITLSEDSFVIYYTKGANAALMMATVSGSVISFPGSEYTFTGQVFDVIQLNSTTVVNAWNAAAVGTAKAGPISSFTVTDRVAGILQEGGSAGQSKPVALFGDISVVHSGLTPGILYYYNTSTGNDVITAPVGYLAGLALGTTELKIVSY